MRTVTLLLLAAVLSGCEFNQIKEQVLADLDKEEPTIQLDECVIGADRLSGLLMQERSYLATTPERKESMLATSLKAKDHAQSALLLSQPDASDKDLKQAQSYYRQQPVRPSLKCPGDRYLVLRQRQTDLQLRVNTRRFSLERENRALRKQIEALTQIEREISQDREINQ